MTISERLAYLGVDARWEYRPGRDHHWTDVVDPAGRVRAHLFTDGVEQRVSIAHPAEPLMRALRSEQPPAEVVLDDLLTVDVARRYLAEQLVDAYQQRDGLRVGRVVGLQWLVELAART
jgi:hypothetical protein